jgi:hypothetical protein
MGKPRQSCEKGTFIIALPVTMPQSTRVHPVLLLEQTREMRES